MKATKWDKGDGNLDGPLDGVCRPPLHPMPAGGSSSSTAALASPRHGPVTTERKHLSGKPMGCLIHPWPFVT